MSETHIVSTPVFESALDELETVVRQLESGDVPLDQALELFERGVKLSRTCRERLDAAERRIEILLKGPDGTRTPVPFADSDSIDEDA